MVIFVVDQYALDEFKPACERLLPGSLAVEYSKLEEFRCELPVVFTGSSAFSSARRELAAALEQRISAPSLNRPSRTAARHEVLRSWGRRVSTMEDESALFPASLRVEHPAGNFETPSLSTQDELDDAVKTAVMASYPRHLIQAVSLLPDEESDRRLRIKRAGNRLIGCPDALNAAAIERFESAGIEVGVLDAFSAQSELVPWRIDDSAFAVLPEPGEVDDYMAGIREWCSLR